MATLLQNGDPERWKALVAKYGNELDEYLKYHPVDSLDELENSLTTERRRVKTRVPGLYESINPNAIPDRWVFDHGRGVKTESTDGTKFIASDVTGPNGAQGFFERAFNPTTGQLEFRNAFLRLSGLEKSLPAWVEGSRIEMVPGRGTPTVQYVTICQIRLLGISAGAPSLSRRVAHFLKKWLGVSLSEAAVITKVKMSTIQNVETIVHLHWLRREHPMVSVNDLLAHTASMRYAETTLIQSGYQRASGIRYVLGHGYKGAIGGLMDYQESRNTERIAETDALLRKYGFNRDTIMSINFDIEFDVSPQ